MAERQKQARRSASVSAPPAARAGMSSGGQALDKNTQATMSARFGHDFSSVRVHTDARAGQSAEALGANAYAVGTDIVFGTGRYAPGSSDGERLLAHELTHVVQQQTLGGGDWGRSSRRGDASEREADGLASQVMMGRSVQVQAAPQAAVARDPDDDKPGQAPSVNPGVPNVPGAADGTQHGDGNGGISLVWDGTRWVPKQAQVDVGRGKPLTIGPADPDTSSSTRQLPPPGPRVDQPDPPPEFTPKPAPDPPITILPPYQYTPKAYSGPQPSAPIAPFPAPPDMTTPLPPPSLFPPASSPVAPMVPPLTMDLPAPVPSQDLPPLPDDQRYA